MNTRTLDSPYPAHWTVRNAREAYLAENGFDMNQYDAKSEKRRLELHEFVDHLSFSKNLEL